MMRFQQENPLDTVLLPTFLKRDMEFGYLVAPRWRGCRYRLSPFGGGKGRFGFHCRLYV